MTIQLTDIFAGKHPITQIYGIGDYSRFGLKGHNGLDFGMLTGTEVWSATDGIVIRAGDFTGTNFNGFGVLVEIWDDKQDVACLYAHLQSAKVKVGDRVHARQPIAISNNTGNSTGPHLHFGVIKTDANGIRLPQYANNGYGGWLNPSEPPTGPSDGTPFTFHWTFTNQVWTPPVQTPPVDPCAGVRSQLAATQADLTAALANLKKYTDWMAQAPK